MHNRGMQKLSTLPSNLVDFSEISKVTISPIDGRYHHQISPFKNYLSEAGINRNRLLVEIRWLQYLSKTNFFKNIPALDDRENQYLDSLIINFDENDISEITKIETITGHDVKAIEYYLKTKLAAAENYLSEDTNLPKYLESIHIFCTSEDINNLAYAIGIKASITEIWIPVFCQFLKQLKELAKTTAEMPMLARTHGQPATPVTMGKEITVFIYRLERQLKRLKKQEYLGKFNGATGTWGAHRIANPEIDWPSYTTNFIKSLGLEPNIYTTQIESHDWQVELYATLAHIGMILHNLTTDFWTYISLGYFQQNLLKQGSTGSSTMPHKVNPIRFENAEANLEISNSLLSTLQSTLSTTRLQRDLTDSSTQRNIGVAFAHSLLALKNLIAGIAGLEPNPNRLNEDLEANWEILGEAIQQTMRLAGINGHKGMEEPYEKLKALTRGRKVDATVIRNFLDQIQLPEELAKRLLALTPKNYLGYSSELARGKVSIKPSDEYN